MEKNMFIHTYKVTLSSVQMLRVPLSTFFDRTGKFKTDDVVNGSIVENERI